MIYLLSQIESNAILTPSISVFLTDCIPNKITSLREYIKTRHSLFRTTNYLFFTTDSR